MKIFKAFLIALGFLFFSAMIFIGGSSGIMERPWELPHDALRFRAYDYFFVKHRVTTLSVIGVYGIVAVIVMWKEVRRSVIEPRGINASLQRIELALMLIVVIVLAALTLID